VKDAIDIADLATLVTVAGVSVYVAGLLGLAIAIRLRYTDDLATAWYAVTLIPRTDVAGQGVQIWLTWPLPIAVLLVLLDTLAKYFGAFNPAMVDTIIPVSVLAVVVLFVVRILRHLLVLDGTEQYSRNLKSGHYIAATGIAVVGGLLMSEGSLLVVRGAREANIPILQVLTHGVFFGPIVFLVGSLLIGVAGAAVLDHPLPRAQVDPDSTVCSPACLAHALSLVTHVEGHWHFLDHAEKELVSVPDKVVLTVHAIPQMRNKRQRQEPRERS
jgi:hypothetical protein